MRFELALTFTAALLSPPAAARSKAPRTPPDARILLARAFSAPEGCFAARGRVQYFPAPGIKPKGLGTSVERCPDGRARVERRKSARKPADMIAVDDGRERRVYWPRLKTVWVGPSWADAPEEQAERLLSLYDARVSTGGHVAKRPTWRLDLLSPRGAVRRSLWVDRASGLALKTETYRLDGTLARRERVVKFEESTPDLARLSLDAPADAAVAPLNEPRPERGSGGGAASFPRWVPEGYIPLEMSGRAAGATSITYGDGAGTFQITEAPRGADFGLDEGSGRAVRLKGGGSAILLEVRGEVVLVRRAAKRAYRISGGLTEDEMARVAESIDERGQ